MDLNRGSYMLQKTATSLTYMYKTDIFYSIIHVYTVSSMCAYVYIYKYCSEFSKYLLAILLLPFLVKFIDIFQNLVF